MGLDQLVKFVFKNEDVNEKEPNITEGHYIEIYFRKNYFLQENMMERCCYTTDVSNDNCINLTVKQKEFNELYTHAMQELQYLKQDMCSYDYADTDWIEEDIKEVIKMFEKFFKLCNKYSENLEILYWQWY